MITWKVWTSASEEPVFEGDEAQASRYVVEHLAASHDAVLESPDGDSYGYFDGVWRCLDTDSVWEPYNGTASSR